MAKKSSPPKGTPTTKHGVTPPPSPSTSLSGQFVPYNGISASQLSLKLCHVSPRVRNAASLADLIRDFLAHDMLRWCNCVRRKYTIDDCVRGCYITGCKCSHQWRIANVAAANATATLSTASLPSAAFNDFDSFYDELRKILVPIKGVRELFYFDAALRIGYHLRKRLMPINSVYIQAGAFVGALELQNKGYIASSIKLTPGSRIPLSAFDPEIQQMACPLKVDASSTALIVEDFLCVCDNDFKNLPQRPVKLTTYPVAVPATTGNFVCHMCNKNNNNGNNVPC
jgi:hypothetical protein